MIVASHQPNFMPYMGFFKKMYLCDVFTLSDRVMYSKRGYHNYNFFNELGRKAKITVPVSIRNEGLISEATLCEWEHNQKKLRKRLENDYEKAPHFKLFYPYFEPILTDYYETLTALNTDLLIVFDKLFRFDCKIVKESDLNITGSNPNEQILDICRKTNCCTYLSGDGAVTYLDKNYLNCNGKQVIWLNYKPLEYGSVPNASAFDYLMYCGTSVPDEWKKEKERLLNGKDF